MSRLTPGGSVCVVTAGVGRRRDLCALATLLRSVSRRPASPAPAAMPAVAAPAARKLRRRGASRSSSAGSAAAAGVPIAGGTSGRSGAASRSCAPSAPAASGGSSSSAAGAYLMTGGLARGIRTSSTAAADATAARVGSRLVKVAVGRVAAAVSPITANTARPARPYAIRRVAAAPMTAAKMASTTRIPLTRTSLSSEPNSVMAKFFSHGGVKSICSSPTATTGDPLAPVSPATNCPTPSAAPAASSPAMAPRPRLARPPPLPLMLMLCIRCGGGPGLARCQTLTIPATNISHGQY